MELRPYQREAVDAVWAHIAASTTNPAVVLPTGSGKTHVIAELCRDAVRRWNGRVVVLAHVKELLDQAAGKLRATAPDLPIGVYSAGLGSRDLGYAVTIAGIQSVYQRAHELGPLDIVIVDEAHLIPPDGDGMYRRFLADARALCDHQRVIGLTATPYRMKTGTICSASSILHEVAYEAPVGELIDAGYLCKLRSKAGEASASTEGVRVRAGEFVAGELEDRATASGLVEAACAEIVASTVDRSSTLIFCAGVAHAHRVAEIMGESHGYECGVVTGETPPADRADIIDRFRCGDLRYVANVNVLTTGFDAPNVDCVAMLRPTMSPGLYYQMVGRGFRTSPGKDDCLVLDFGGNTLRHGPVDDIRTGEPSQGAAGGEPAAKVCPSCAEIVALGAAACTSCGYEFPPPEPSHEATAAQSPVLSSELTGDEYRVVVHPDRVTYHVHTKAGRPDAPTTMRVEYHRGLSMVCREWVCLSHDGFPRRKAEQWWRRRSRAPVPDSTEHAVELARAGALAQPTEIEIDRPPGSRFDELTRVELGPIPDPPEVACVEDNDDSWPFDFPEDEIPF